MKIMIIGGGLFGVHIAGSISDLVDEVHIFEKQDRLFTGASSNNQHRFHFGPHYPRSPETVEQIKKTIPSFLNVFSDCIFTIFENYYLIENNSKINSKQFYDIFSYCCKEYEKDQIEEVKMDNIHSAFLTDEKGIDLKKLKQNLKYNLEIKKNVKIFYNIKTVEESFKNYDLIINCSYWDVNLTSDLKIKYELCLLPILENPLKNNKASYTIVDGEFVSLYKTQNENIYTLSSVKYTPFFKTNNYQEFLNAFHNKNDFNIKEVQGNILEHASQYFKFNKVYFLEPYLSPKIKLLDDFNDKRLSSIIFDGKFITLLQGKISTLPQISTEIQQKIKQLLGEE